MTYGCSACTEVNLTPSPEGVFWENVMVNRIADKFKPSSATPTVGLDNIAGKFLRRFLEDNAHHSDEQFPLRKFLNDKFDDDGEDRVFGYEVGETPVPDKSVWMVTPLASMLMNGLYHEVCKVSIEATGEVPKHVHLIRMVADVFAAHNTFAVWRTAVLVTSDESGSEELIGSLCFASNMSVDMVEQGGGVVEGCTNGFIITRSVFAMLLQSNCVICIGSGS